MIVQLRDLHVAQLSEASTRDAAMSYWEVFGHPCGLWTQNPQMHPGAEADLFLTYQLDWIRSVVKLEGNGEKSLGRFISPLEYAKPDAASVSHRKSYLCLIPILWNCDFVSFLACPFICCSCPACDWLFTHPWSTHTMILSSRGWENWVFEGMSFSVCNRHTYAFLVVLRVKLPALLSREITNKWEASSWCSGHIQIWPCPHCLGAFNKELSVLVTLNSHSTWGVLAVFKIAPQHSFMNTYTTQLSTFVPPSLMCLRSYY